MESIVGLLIIKFTNKFGFALNIAIFARDRKIHQHVTELTTYFTKWKININIQEPI